MFVNIDRIPEFFHSDFSLYLWLEELCDNCLLIGTEYNTPLAQVARPLQGALYSKDKKHICKH